MASTFDLNLNHFNLKLLALCTAVTGTGRAALKIVGAPLPTSDVVSSEHIPMLFAQTQAVIAKLLKRAKRVSLTLDGWSNFLARGYLGESLIGADFD